MDEFINLTGRQCKLGSIKAALFDFDGTISTLRCGWEEVMRSMMLAFLKPDTQKDDVYTLVDQFIDESTGIQTIHQMKWLKEQVNSRFDEMDDKDEWWYKDVYNTRLMEKVNERIAFISKHPESREQYLIKGAQTFLQKLKENGIKLYLASGTDHKDVVNESRLLQVDQFFDVIKGAPAYQTNCSKEAVIDLILNEENLAPETLVVIGDGKVEIALGEKQGAFTIGVASDEVTGEGINPFKKQRLTAAGADILVGNFSNTARLLHVLGL